MFDKLISNAVSKAGTSAVFNEGDYYAPCFDDEPELTVMYCGVCNRKKEFYPYIPTIQCDSNTVASKQYRRYFMSNNKPHKVSVECECAKSKNTAYLNRNKLRIRSRELKKKCWGYTNEYGEMIENHNMESIVFDKYSSNRHIEKARSYLDSIDKRLSEHMGITFLGNTGSGKTIASMCLANAMMDKGIDVEFRQQFQITSLSQFDNKAELEKLQNCTVLFIDDFSPKSLTDYGEELIFNLIELRIKRGLITCYTSNLNTKIIKSPPKTSKKRLYERMNKTTYIVEDSTNNYRAN